MIMVIAFLFGVFLLFRNVENHGIMTVASFTIVISGSSILRHLQKGKPAADR
jgi:hypothetical protein